MFDRNGFVKVRGTVTTYNCRYEIALKLIRRAVDGEMEADDYLPRTDKNIDELLASLHQFIGSIQHPLLHTFFEDGEIIYLYRLAPAAKSIHRFFLRVTAVCF